MIGDNRVNPRVGDDRGVDAMEGCGALVVGSGSCTVVGGCGTLVAGDAVLEACALPGEEDLRGTFVGDSSLVPVAKGTNVGGDLR